MEAEKTSKGNLFDIKLLKRLFVFAKPYISQFWILVLLTLLIAVLGPLKPKIVQLAIDNELAVGDYEGVVNMVLLMVLLLLLQALVQYFHTFLAGWLGQNIIKDIRIKLYAHIQNLELKFFDKTPIGRLVTRNVSDIETLAEVFTQGIAAMIGDILMLLFIFSMMIWESWKLSLVSFTLLPILFFATYIFKEKIKVAFNDVRNAVSNLNTFVQEHITGISIVQIFNAEKREYNKFEKINRQHRKANMKSVLYFSIYFPVAEIIQAGAIGLILWYGSGAVIQEEFGLGVLIAFIMYIQMFFRPIRMIADRFNTLQMGVVSTSRIMKLLDSKEFLPDSGKVVKEKIEGTVTFRNVYFAYQPNEWVLKDINFEISSGKTLALVGETGAGKSSIVNLINRFYDINKGEILIDGIEVKAYDLHNLRSHIGVVLQDVFLFSDTIYNNITMQNDTLSEATVYEAAERVGAREFIEQFPKGFAYNVKERGSTLSVGQRQLISFVRTMVYDPQIIILDEATSSVDTETELLIQNAIAKMMKNRTAIVVAHRLSTIQKADTILVMDKGRIVEKGNHSYLLSLGGYYNRLYEMQYKKLEIG